MKRKRTILRKKTRNCLVMFDKRSEPKFRTANFATEKNIWHRCRWRQVLFIISAPIFQAVEGRTKVSSSDGNSQNYSIATKLGQVLILLLDFPFKHSVPPNSLHFATNPLNPQRVTSMQNSEILSLYLSIYSVEPQRPPPSTTVPPPLYHTGSCPVFSKAPLLPREDGSSNVSSFLSVGSIPHLQSWFLLIFIYKFCDFSLICISYRKWYLKYSNMPK